jgi:hypothetical protein
MKKFQTFPPHLTLGVTRATQKKSTDVNVTRGVWNGQPSLALQEMNGASVLFKQTK